jgi:hypothetical protein
MPHCQYKNTSKKTTRTYLAPASVPLNFSEPLWDQKPRVLPELDSCCCEFCLPLHTGQLKCATNQKGVGLSTKNKQLAGTRSTILFKIHLVVVFY